MEYHINEERQHYLDARGKVILKACPGSGKTTTVAYKLSTLIEEHRSAFGAHSGIACLSFTNTAKDEIEEKHKSFSKQSIGFPDVVSTIDSFINQYIVLPHYHLLNSNIKRPSILESTYSINDFALYHLNRFRRKNIPLRNIYKPSDISISLRGTFLHKGGIPNGTRQEQETFNTFARSLKIWQFSKGYLTPNDTNYAALQLLTRFPNIGKYLIQRFPTLIIDEGQDTSEIQFAIIDKLIQNGLSNVEIIGDPYQSLYEWREARPDLFEERFQDNENWIPLKLDRCRRSVQKIINQYQILRNEDTALVSDIDENEIPISVIRYVEGAENDAVERYLEISEGHVKKCIAVRGRTLLNTLLGRTGSKIEPWKKSIPYAIILASKELKKGNTKNAINSLRKIIPDLIIPNADFETKKNLLNELRTDIESNSKLFNLLTNIPSFNNSLIQWTTETQQLLMDTYELDDLPDFELKQGVWRPKHAILLCNVMELTELPNRPVTTIHQIKGNTFDSLLLFLSKNSSGQNISINDIQKPEAFPDEKKRMIYVAMSRPRNQLVIAVCNDKSEEEIKAILGDNVQIINA